ncbi:hypothetical protein F9L30_23755 [Escherichia coli]|nr:hypothetical protein [Escherichia coli]EFW6853327.1 hypothetical protein [Shigella sonnei]EAA5677128.1 hypothetical protein [Escherichia coli]EEV9345023.1 hypothetical protein [Escherichia coli]EEX2593681.1 hypothetical protein [Escherichia coli]
MSGRKVFPADDSVKKVVWLTIQSASQKWTMMRLSAAPPHSKPVAHASVSVVAPLQPRKVHLTSAQYALQRVNLQ